VEIGFRSGSVSPQRSFIQTNIVRNSNSNIAISEESLMLTGDENILDINFVVQWKVSNLKDFAFNVANPEETVKSAAESSMREVIANSKLAVALTDGRSKIQQEAKDLLQNMLNSYNAGIEITALQMQKVDPPSEVTDAFRDVQTAKTDKERLINEAYAFKNDLLPRARGDAAQLIQEGTAYKKEVTERALGDVSRFNAIYAEFRKAGDVTKKRIYFETMESILKNMDKMIIDNKNSGVVPYLPLPNLNKQ
jgi:membrane protease subunit HflK